MDSAIYPGIAAADTIEDLLGSTSAGSARFLYGGQKADLAAVLARLRLAPLVSADRASAATLLQMIAGTAAYFDDEALGDLARSSEQPMTDLVDPSHIVALCDRLLPLSAAG